MGARDPASSRESFQPVILSAAKDLVPSAAHEIEAAWKRVMILNQTEVLYTFTFDAQTGAFTARKR